MPGRLDLVPTPAPEVGRRRTRPDRGSGQQGLDTGRVDSKGWTLDGWTATGRIGGPRTTDAGDRPDTGGAGHRTAGQPDLGRRTGWLDTACRTPGPTPRRRPGGVDHGDDAGALEAAAAPLAGAGWAVYDQERSAARTTRAPRCSGRAWAPPRRLAAGGTPPSSWRLGALLSSDEFRVERRTSGDASSVMQWRVWGRQTSWCCSADLGANAKARQAMQSMTDLRSSRVAASSWPPRGVW